MRSLILALMLVGCAAPMKKNEFNSLSVGMDKAEVIKIMGPPDMVAAQKGGEYLKYKFATSHFDTDGSDTSEYFVKILGGKVDSFGRMGDFGSTQPYTQKVIVEKSN